MKHIRKAINREIMKLQPQVRYSKNARERLALLDTLREDIR